MSWLWSSRRRTKEEEEEEDVSHSASGDDEEEWTSSDNDDEDDDEEEEEEDDEEEEQEETNDDLVKPEAPPASSALTTSALTLTSPPPPPPAVVVSTMPTGDDSGPEPRSSAVAALFSLPPQPLAHHSAVRTSNRGSGSRRNSNSNNTNNNSLADNDDNDDNDEPDSNSSSTNHNDDDDDASSSSSFKITKVERLHIPQAVEVLQEPSPVANEPMTTTTSTTTNAATTTNDATTTNATSSSSWTRVVGGNRPRVDSAMSSSSHSQPHQKDHHHHHDDDVEEDVDDDEEEKDHDDDEEDDDEEEEDPDIHSTSLAEKQSLLSLAAEHDRVDILQAILTEDVRATLLAPPIHHHDHHIPPLHLAVAYGSVHAVHCLLRMGANPSLRPQAPGHGTTATTTATTTTTTTATSPSLDRATIHRMARYEGRTAWELVFGTETTTASATTTTSSTTPSPSPSSSLSSFSPSLLRRTSSNAVDSTTTTTTTTTTTAAIVDLPPSKREGIRHAFTAEALRCIGSDDDAIRLQQLLQAGMPATIDIGGKSLYDWAVEMSAPRCEELLRPTEAAKYEPTPADQRPATPVSHTAPVVHRPDRTELSGPSLVHYLLNRLDELDSLARALSISLDALAEEASVCNGLLLMGGGAAALAAHVRSLKATQERKRAALVRLEEAWENAQDELAYWVREGGPDASRIADTIRTAPPSSSEQQQRRASLLASMEELTAAAKAGNLTEEQVNEQQDQLCRQITAQIAASEHKICKLRASIADLSEVWARDLAQVEARGLAGGVTLVRGLRDEIRDLEFAVAEVQSAEATCRMKIALIQANGSPAAVTAPGMAQPPDSVQSTESVPTRSSSTTPTTTTTTTTATTTTTNGDHRKGNEHRDDTPTLLSTAAAPDSDQTTLDSQRIAAGQSTAIALRHGSGHQGFFPLSLWEIILRIIGLGEDRGANNSSSIRHSQPVMIV